MSATNVVQLSEYRDAKGRQIVTLSYTRLSNDPQGRKLTHKTQNREIDGLVTRWELPPILPQYRFSDTDKSASDPNIIRPGYRRLLQTIRSFNARQYCVVVAGYKQERILRQPAETQAFGQLLGIEKGGRLITHVEGEVGLVKGGRQLLILNGALGQIETDNTSVRTMGGVETAAMNGKAHGTRRYGWTRQHRTVGAGKPEAYEVLNEEQAQVIRDIADRLLKGDSLHSIANDLNAAGVPTPGAGRILRRDEETRAPVEGAVANSKWEPQKIREILVRASNDAVRKHTQGKGEMATTHYYEAEWPRILDHDVYVNVCAKFADPDRRKSTSNVLIHLLSNVATCENGHPVYGQKTHTSASVSYKAYRCRHSCVVKSMARVDAYVERVVIDTLSRPEVRAMLTPPQNVDIAATLTRKAAIEAKQAEAADMWRSDQITRAQLVRMNESLAEQLAECEAILTRSHDQDLFWPIVSAKNMPRVWTSLPLDRKRSIIKALFTVTICKSQRGRGAWSEETVRVELRELVR